MSNIANPQILRRTARRWLWPVVGCTVALLAGAAIFLQSAVFREMLRQRVVRALEDATGMRVDLRQFSFEPGRLEVALRGITVSDPESPGEPPLFSAELVEAQWKILSFWGLRADLRSLRIWNPRVYIGLAGNSLHQAAADEARRLKWIGQALDIRARRLEVLRGQIQVKAQGGEETIPLDLLAENVQLALEYDSKERDYSGKLDFQKAVLTRAGATAAFTGRARFAVNSKRVALQSMDLRSAASTLSALGSLDNFAAPRVKFRFDLNLDWKEAAAFLGRTGWQGQAAWRAEADYSQQQGWQLQGPLAMRAIRMAIPLVPSLPWSGHGSLLLTGTAAAGQEKPNAPAWRAEWSDLTLDALGGRFRGRADAGLSPDVSARLDLIADRVSVGALTGELRKAVGDLPELGTAWAGFVSGPTKIDFPASGSRFSVSTDWHVEPSPVIPPGFRPVSGLFRVAYQSGPKRFAIEDSALSFGDTRLTADGWLDPADSRLSVSIDDPRSQDVRPLLRLFWKKSGRLPIRLHGPVHTDFLWTGGRTSPRIAGNFQVADFDYQGLRWNAFAGRFNFQQGRAQELKIDSGKLLRGKESLEFNAALEFDQGAFTPRSPFTLAATLRDGDLDDLRKIAGGWLPAAASAELPVSGLVNGSVQVSGTLDDPRGKGNLEMTAGRLYGESFSRLTSQLDLQAGGLLSARQLRMEKGQGAVEGSASIGLSSKQIQFSLTASNLALEGFNFLRGRLPVTGLMGGRLSGSGVFMRPALQGQVEINRLAVAGHPFGNVSIGLDAADGQAKLHWDGNPLGGQVRGTASVQFQPGYPYSARVDFLKIDGVSLLRLLRDVPPLVQAQVAGTFTLQGNLADAAASRADGEISVLSGSAGSLDFHNFEPARFAFENGTIHLQPARLSAENTDLAVSGTVSLVRDQALNLAMRETLNLAALNSLLPDLKSSGQGSLNATLSGTLSKPFFKGRMDLSDVALRFGALPNGLSNLDGTLIVDGNRATLQNVTAESGGGSVKLAGQLTYSPEGPGVQLAAELANVRIRYPEGLSTWLDGQLTLRGSPKASTLEGNLVIGKEMANPEFDVGALLVKQQNQPLLRAQTPALRNLHLDVHIASAPNVTFETTTAKNLRGDVDLRLQGSLEHPSLLGRISVLEGEVTIGGRRYLADRGELTFSNPFQIEPTLDLQLRATVGRYDVRLNFNGPLDHLAITYSSEPPIPTSEVLALLVAGSSYSASLHASETATAPQLGTSSLLSQELSQQMGSRLNRIFGAGNIHIDPQIAGFNQPANANVALEQQIRDNLTLLYVSNVNSAQQQIIQAEYSLTPRFGVAATRDQNGLIGLSFQIRLRFR